MKYTLLLTVMLVTTGCTVVPVTAKFPNPAGSSVMERCPDLEKLTEDTKLSDVSKTITNNYTKYHECAIKVDAWQAWYKAQKEVFEKAGK